VPIFSVASKRLAILGAAASALSGCDLTWEKPELASPPPPQFREAKTKSSLPIPAGADFAAKFGSRELTAVVASAVGDNLDIAAAVARIREADSQARVSSATLWPTIGMQDIVRTTATPGTTTVTSSSSGGINLSGSSTSSGFTTRHYGFFQLGLTASYEIDFWGKNEDASLAARLLANASRFDRDVVEIGTVASVLNAYLQVVAAQDRIRIARNNVKLAAEVFAAINARVEVGTATALDQAQQETVLAQQRAAIPPLELTLRQTRNNLAVLLGRPPESFDVKGGSLTSLTFPKVTPGLPSEVLLRRPDVAEAEAKLASQEFSVLQARAAFFPSITLTGTYGLQSALLQNLLRPEAIAWQIGGQLAQPLLDGYNLQGQYELQKGKYAELAALYKKQILTALGDVENALIAIRENKRRVDLQAQATDASRRALEAANARLREGTIDIVTLSTTEVAYFTNQDTLVQARLAYYQAAVSLYQALGGGWSPTTRGEEVSRAEAAYNSDKGPWP